MSALAVAPAKGAIAIASRGKNRFQNVMVTDSGNRATGYRLNRATVLRSYQVDTSFEALLICS